MIKIDKKFYGSEVNIDGTYKEIIKDLENIIRALVYNGFDKEDLRKALVDGFYVDPECTPVDGRTVSDNDIKKIIHESLDEPIENSIKKIKQMEESSNNTEEI